MAIDRQFEQGILAFTFANPPLNTLSVGSGLVEDLIAAVADALDDDRVEAMILTGADGNFCAGADIKDFDGPAGQPDILRQLLNLVETARKPIVAAIDGFCFGGGLELALAAHHRVASARARFAFPEISLGLLPGAGGTQRAPRLAGAANALGLMLDGKPIDAAQAVRIGLADHLVARDPLSHALSMLEAGQLRAPRRSCDLPPPADLATALADANATGRLDSEAARQIGHCVAAIGEGDFNAGLAIEAERFAALMASRESRALRHGFLGRRTVRHLPGIPAHNTRPIARVTIIGGGVMGTGIALAVLQAGLPVAVVEPQEDARERARETIARTIVRNVEKGRLSEDAADRQLAALRVVGQIADAAEADLFIEAVFEDMAAKQEVFGELDRLAPPHAILASNTSTLDLNAIAACTSRPASVVGLHFFSPAHLMRLLEVVRGSHTAPETLRSAMDFARRIGKTGVLAGVCDGFIGNRMFEEYLRQAWFLLEEGALPRQVDAALEAFGFAMGPCRVMDLAGQDIGWSIRKRRAVDQPGRPYSRIPDLICELGRFGQKTGAGMYRYADGRTPEDDPAITELISAESARLSLARRPIADKEIVARCVLALVNEGAKILEEGIALRPVDIDVVYLDGYGFPAARGGPMFHADTLGLDTVLATIREFAAGRHGWAWEPSALLVDRVERGGTFSELNEK